MELKSYGIIFANNVIFNKLIFVFLLLGFGILGCLVVCTVIFFATLLTWRIARNMAHDFVMSNLGIDLEYYEEEILIPFIRRYKDI
ncbi:hypothetical protein [Armatimonas sp.]|uniref:hypothetical protein n=1 Tax=Armatimonas sp. TaxID=1872638 RepID=UPI00286AC3B2|nr:hypothetical protein [Armatimonas sp.]